ncbi:unnamed protein product [Dracunculus medinensis]|uniref:C2H2-type domain-containing protein n=1 Tax=Dracunculus medinensis TaxID=318479 RepID=A0A0N4UJW3_DRAME|nr:unnamed protein product [Dracunculus medinensis]
MIARNMDEFLNGGEIVDDPFLPIVDGKLCVCCEKGNAEWMEGTTYDFDDYLMNFSISHRNDWIDLISSNNGNNDGIEVDAQDFFCKTFILRPENLKFEIYLNDKDSLLPIDLDGPRKRYQRFRAKRFICDHCDRSFTLKQNIQYHIVNYHLKNQNIRLKRGRRYVCRVCQKMFKSGDLARKHHERKHVQLPAISIHRCSTWSDTLHAASSSPDAHDASNPVVHAISI